MTAQEPQHIFLDKSAKPTENTLKAGLGKAWPHYVKIRDLATGFVAEWNFTKSSGWLQKFHDKKKALFYFIPLKSAIKIGMAVRETERAVFLAEAEIDKATLDQIESARKYVEGYAVHFMVVTARDYAVFEKFMRRLIELRKGR